LPPLRDVPRRRGATVLVIPPAQTLNTLNGVIVLRSGGAPS
jgi:hypothetical protein